VADDGDDQRLPRPGPLALVALAAVHETLDDDDIPDSRFTPEQAALFNEARRRIGGRPRLLARQRGLRCAS
jgi:hypothetical protein